MLAKRDDVTRWWWVRHAPVINPSGAIYGRGDIAADTTDTEAYDGLSALLPDDPVWMHSSLLRTRQTAAAVIAARQRENPAFKEPEFVVEEAFMEQFFGEWQGQQRADLRDQLKRQHPLWLAPASQRPPGGESFIDMMARVGHGIEEHNARHAGRDIVCFAHGGTIRSVLAYTMGIAPEASLGFQIDNLSITELTYYPDKAGEPAYWAVGGVNIPPVHGLQFNIAQMA
ncbi:MAG: histidine phosphatase family protein [Pseudomonadota bacterium]